MQNMVSWPYKLTCGHSDNPADGACIMDAINWLVHGQHGDTPPCVDPIFINFCILGNDSMRKKKRQEFLSRAHLLSGSFDPDSRKERLRIIVHKTVVNFAPMVHEKYSWAKDLPYDFSYGELVSRFDCSCELGIKFKTMINKATYLLVAPSEEAAEIACLLSTRKKYKKVWDKYFEILDAALAAGKTGEPWSACDIDIGIAKFKAACELVAT